MGSRSRPLQQAIPRLSKDRRGKNLEGRGIGGTESRCKNPTIWRLANSPSYISLQEVDPQGLAPPMKLKLLAFPGCQNAQASNLNIYYSLFCNKFLVDIHLPWPPALSLFNSESTALSIPAPSPKTSASVSNSISMSSSFSTPILTHSFPPKHQI